MKNIFLKKGDIINSYDRSFEILNFSSGTYEVNESILNDNDEYEKAYKAYYTRNEIEKILKDYEYKGENVNVFFVSFKIRRK